MTPLDILYQIEKEKQAGFRQEAKNARMIREAHADKALAVNHSTFSNQIVSVRWAITLLVILIFLVWFLG